MKIKIVCATQKKLNIRQIILIRIISSIFDKDTEVIMNNENRSDIFPNINKRYIEMNSELFDFSRYYSALENIKEDSIILAFNDTLGKGRKLNIPLYLFIIKSIMLIKKEEYNLCAPIDYDKESKWLCPYFFIAKRSILIKFNWINHEKALLNTPQNDIDKMETWTFNGWRSADIATEKQRKIKLKTLILEKRLIENQQDIKIYAFSKYSIWRILNSIFPF